MRERVEAQSRIMAMETEVGEFEIYFVGRIYINVLIM